MEVCDQGKHISGPSTVTNPDWAGPDWREASRVTVRSRKCLAAAPTTSVHLAWMARERLAKMSAHKTVILSMLVWHYFCRWYSFLINKSNSSTSIRRWRGSVMACISIANIVKTSLGPVGLDKMLVDDIGDTTVIIIEKYFIITAPQTQLVLIFPASRWLTMGLRFWIC
jgi:hypothetical protein